MKNDEYLSLCQKYLSGNCTEEEETALKEYQATLEPNDQLWNETIMGDKGQMREAIYSMVEGHLNTPKKFRVSRQLIQWSAAAAVLVVVFGGLYLTHNPKPIPALVNKEIRFKNDVSPGTNKAILTLDNGSTIILDDAAIGVLATQGNSEIKKERKDQLIYNVTGSDRSANNSQMNTVSTPLGGEYQIVLPDGSKVWLNAGSSLKFPTAFTGMERKVELSGEAYFEIAKNKARPFRVMVNDMQVRVLGTHFNIMAYNNENKISTTLVEGSVEIINGTGQKYLKPGERATFSRNTKNLGISTVNVKKEVAWKEGDFIFNGETIQSVMRKISRWYNVEVDYQGTVSNNDFVGTISRDKNISEVLQMLELTGVVHFKIEGRRITVMP